MSGCGFSIGDYDCRDGGYMYDAGSGEGWSEDECDFICPHCRTKDYLESAKEEAESTSSYSGSYGSGTGVTIWSSSEATALQANRPAAIRALIEIGIVNAIEDADNEEGFSVVMCNTQPALSLLSDYDALAQKLAASQARVAELEGDGSWGDAALTVKLAASQEAVTEQALYAASEARRAVTAEAELAARDIRLADAVGLLRSMTIGYHLALEKGRDLIVFLGGDCDSVEKMESDNPEYGKARAFLSGEEK